MHRLATAAIDALAAGAGCAAVGLAGGPFASAGAGIVCGLIAAIGTFKGCEAANTIHPYLAYAHLLIRSTCSFAALTLTKRCNQRLCNCALHA